MLLFIVPVFEKMFEGLGGQLPLPTQILVVLSHAMVWVAPLLIVVGIVFAVWWRKNKNTETVRSGSTRSSSSCPSSASCIKKIAVARFTRNFSNMIGAGVPILQALRIVGETSGNWVIERRPRAGGRVSAPGRVDRGAAGQPAGLPGHGRPR